MIHYLPPLIMFLVTVGVVALFVLPIKRVRPESGVLRFYWRGVWLFLVAITCVAGAMNTLVLLGIDVVSETEAGLNLLLPAFVVFVVVGWFHTVGLGMLKLGRKALRS